MHFFYSCYFPLFDFFGCKWASFPLSLLNFRFFLFLKIPFVGVLPWFSEHPIKHPNRSEERTRASLMSLIQNNKGFLLRADALTDKDFSLEYKIKSTATSRGIAKSEFQGKKWSLVSYSNIRSYEKIGLIFQFLKTKNIHVIVIWGSTNIEKYIYFQKHVRIVNPRVVPDKIFVAIEKLLSMKLPLKLDLSNVIFLPSIVLNAVSVLPKNRYYRTELAVNLNLTHNIRFCRFFLIRRFLLNS